MATSRRKLKELNQNTLSPKLRASRVSKLRNRHEYSDNSDHEFSESDEGTDEPDRCLTDRLRSRDNVLLSHSLEDLSQRRERLHRSLQSNCESNKTPYISTTKRTQRKLYPDLSEVEKEDRSKRHHNGLTPSVLIAVVLVVILSIFILWQGLQKFHLTSGVKETKTMIQIEEQMRRDLITLSQMTEQTNQFWIQILAQLNILTEASPLQPAIILAIVPSDARKTAACLSQRILEVVSAAFEDAKYISFDVHSHMGRNSTVLKHDLDEVFQGLTESHAVGVYNLEKLVPEAAMIFHAYCDNENAPHKRAFFLLTMEVEVIYSSMSLDRLDSSAYRYLMELWSGSLREDDSAAIISRIANAPVMFRPEKSESVLRLCPY